MSDLGHYETEMSTYWLEDADLWLWQCRELTKEAGWEDHFIPFREKKAGREFPRLPRLIVLSIYFAEFISLLKRAFRS